MEWYVYLSLTSYMYYKTFLLLAILDLKRKLKKMDTFRVFLTIHSICQHCVLQDKTITLKVLLGT